MNNENLDWGRLINDYRNSSLSKDAWCKAFGVSPELLSEKLVDSIHANSTDKLEICTSDSSVSINDKWATIEYSNLDPEYVEAKDSDFTHKSALKSGLKIYKEKLVFEIPDDFCKEDLLEMLEVITNGV